jgi:hypothetical protein
MTQAFTDHDPITGTARLRTLPDLDVIEAEARQVRPARTVATAFTAAFWALGWLAGILILGLAWAAVAVRRGYRDALRGAAGASDAASARTPGA